MDAATVARLRKGLAAKMDTQPKKAIAKAIGVSPVTLYAFVKNGTAQPETLGKVKRYLDAPEPQRPSEYWQGVYYAAEAMSETLTRLLREARQAAPPIGPSPSFCSELYARTTITASRLRTEPAGVTTAVGNCNASWVTFDLNRNGDTLTGFWFGRAVLFVKRP